MSWVSVSWLVSDTRDMFCLILWACGLEFTWPRRLLFYPSVLCFLLLHAVRVLSAVCIHVMSCAVWHAACVFHGLHAFMLSCLVWTRRLWVFSLAACPCPVLLATCLCFYFVWAHGFVLVFYVPCALMSICLNPTHLVSWLLVNLPHLSFLVSLLICSLYNLLVFAVLCQFVIVSTLVVSCLALPCLALPCLALPCLALPCLALSSQALLSAVLFSPYGVVFVAVFIFINKSPSLCTTESSPHPSTHTLTFSLKK